MKKRALLLGVSDYENCDNLEAVSNDISLFKLKLNMINFDVQSLLNMRLSDLKENISNFLKIAPCDSINIIYFSGHGFQYKGENYIVPANFSFDLFNAYNIKDLFDNEYKDIDLILVIDACRNNLSDEFVKNYSEVLSPPKRTLISYSTSFGDVSECNKNISFFTKSICDNITKPNLSVNQLFEKVRFDMHQTGYPQEPITLSKMYADVVFNQIIEIEDIDKAIYEYIEKYGDGYESIFGYVKGEYETFIEASEYYGVSLLDAYNSYDKVSKSNFKQTLLEEATTKLITFKIMLERNLFEHDEIYNWYYCGRRIRMGEIPITPNDMEYLEPIDGQKIDVKIECDVKGNEAIIKTNLPTDFIMLIKINKSISSNTFIVNNNPIIVQNNIPINNIVISSVIANQQPKTVKEKIGERGRNLNGENVKFDIVNGNQISYLYLKS